MLKTVNHAPFVRRGPLLPRLQAFWLIALAPVTGYSIILYGLDAFRVAAVSVSVCMLTEAGFQRLSKKPLTLSHGSAAVTGLLFALLIPASAPLHLVLIGAFTTIFLGRIIFGGMGASPFNPVLVGWAVLRLSWPQSLDPEVMLFIYNAVPLPGRAIGIAAGGLFLIATRIVSWRIPAAMLLSILVFGGLFAWAAPGTSPSVLTQLTAGHTLFAVFFLSTDDSSSPVNPWAQLIYGFSAGLLLLLFRQWSVTPDGSIFALLLMNLFTPLCDKIRRPPRPAGQWMEL